MGADASTVSLVLGGEFYGLGSLLHWQDERGRNRFFRPRGGSMSGITESGQLFGVELVDTASHEY